MFNGVAWTSQGFNLGGLVFDGADDYVRIPHHAYLNAAPVFTMTLWLKKHDLDNMTGLLLGKMSGNIKEYALWAEGGMDGGLLFEQTNSAGTAIVSLPSRLALDADRWYHVSLVVENEKVRLYLDGELEAATERLAQNAAITTAPLTFGASDTGTNAFDGTLDEIGIYGTRLSTDRILDESGRLIYWKLDQASGTSATNSGTYGVNGTLVNGPVWASAEGRNGGCIVLDGVDDYVSIPDTQTPPLSGNVGFSLWYKKTGDLTENQFIASKGDNEFVLYQEAGASQHLIFEQLAADGTPAISLASNALIPNGVWTHVAVSMDGNLLSLYINGELDASAYRTAAPLTQNSSFHLGSDLYGQHPFYGAMDDLQIYRRPLGVEQIFNLSGRVGHWRFDEDAGTSVADASYLANDGALTGPAGWVMGEGVVDGCLQFNGAGQRVNIPDAVQLQLPNDFTVSLWARKTSEASAKQILLTKGSLPCNYVLYEEAGAGKHIIFEQSSSSGPVLQLTSLGTMELNEWTHIAVSMKDGLGTLYLNGVNNGSAVRTIGSGSGLISTAPLTVGADAAGAYGFSGQVDELEIFDRARTVNEVNTAAAASATDTDGDGLLDSWERQYFGDLQQNGGGDFDADGLSNLVESQKGANPTQFDSDNDGMPDKWEVDKGFNAAVNDSGLDADGDGLNNLREYRMNNNPLVADADAEAGSTAGGLTVGLAGDASYSMPIVVTPGTAGMTPKLSLNYSSQGGAGWLGVGWSLGGYSSIQRTPQARIYDGVAGSLNFDSNDRLALDGQRLLITNGSYWAGNSKYRTEIDNFQRVTMVSGTEFKVMTKSGLILTYGGTADSVVKNSAGQILQWSISKMADTKGNYLTLSYNADFATTGEHYPTRIDYTLGNGNAAGYASVTFVYENRPDISTGYSAGIFRAQRKRLRQINNLYGSALVRRYEIGYETSPLSKRSRVISITEKSGSGVNYYKPTLFTYGNGNGNLPTNPIQFTGGAYNYSAANTQWMEGDFDGDGFGDIARIAPDSSSAKIVVYEHNGSTFTPSVWNNNGYFESTDIWQAGDFNGDGKLDLLRISNDGGDVQLELFANGGTSFSKSWNQFDTHNFTPFNRWFAGDYNADGKLDLICVYGSSSDGLSGNTMIRAFINNGAGFSRQDWANSDTDFQITSQFIPGDFSGDGLPDVAMRYDDNGDTNGGNSSFLVFKNTGTAFTHSNWNLTGASSFSDYSWSAGDFNGDGLLDLLKLKINSNNTPTSLAVHLSTGTAFLPSQSWGNITTNSTNRVLSGDYNGDGRSDLAVISEYSLDTTADYPVPPGQTGPKHWENYFTRSEYRSDGYGLDGQGFYPAGTTTTEDPDSGYPEYSKRFFAADFNGDGKEDLCRMFVRAAVDANTATTANFMIWQDDFSIRDTLLGTTNGYGATTTLVYKPLTDATVYTKATAIIPTAINLFPAIPVISSISSDDGQGGSRTVNYFYTGLRASPTRGLLGFETVTTTDNLANTKNVTWLNQEFPFIGAVTKTETSVRPATAWQLVSRTTNTWSSMNTATTTVVFPAPLTSVTETFDLDGTFITRLTTSNAKQAAPAVLAYDTYGNALETKTTSYDPVASQTFWKRTVNTYAVTASDTLWQIGKLLTSSVESDGTGQANEYRSSSFTYDATLGFLNNESIEPGSASSDLPQSTTYEFDAFGNTKSASVTAWAGKYDATGAALVGDETRTTTTTFDPTGRFPVELKNALNQKETRTYDLRLGLLTSVTGPNNLTTRTYYDDFGRVSREVRADGTETLTRYYWVVPGDTDAPANTCYVVESTSSGSPAAKVYFDKLGRELRKWAINPAAKKVYVDTEYDSLGRVWKVSRPRFSTDTVVYRAEKQYDVLNRVIKEITPDDTGTLRTTTLSYDGLFTTAINPSGQTTTSQKNALGQVVKVTDHLGGSISYVYDADGNLKSTTHATPVSGSLPATSSITTMSYDDRGRKIAMNDPDMGAWTYRYSGFGELVKQTSPNGAAIMEYDKLGRMTKRTETEGISTWQYDSISGLASGKSIGKLIRSTAPASQGGTTHTILYDNLGRPCQETTVINGSSYVTQTNYDELGRVSETIYPSAFKTCNIYNNNGALTEIRRDSGSGTRYWRAEDWEADGSIKKERLGNNVVTERSQAAPTGRLASITSGVNGGTGLQDLAYTFDRLGNLTGRQDYKTGKTETFTYDGLNRLLDAQITGGDLLQTRYDLRGNLTLKRVTNSDGVTQSNINYTYGDVARPNRLTAIQNQSYTYDGCGNMTQLGGRTVAWTSWNMVSSITGAAGSSFAGVSAGFQYDAERSRVKQTSVDAAGLTTTTYYMGAYEKITRGLETEQRHHISGPTGPIAVFSLNSLTSTSPEETNYLLKDHLGSIVLVTNTSGGVVTDNTFSFDAWGKRRNPITLSNLGAATDYYSKTTAKTTRGFTGHEELDDLGLVHMNGRLYNPELGRFISADPYVQAPEYTQSYNRYAYVMNNPLTATDPSGYFSWGAVLGAVVAVVAGIVTAGVAWAAYAAAIGAYGTFGAALGAAATGAAFTGAGLAAGAVAYGGAVVAGAGFGFGSAFAGTLYAGGSMGQALKAGAIGGIVGAISGGFAHGIGTWAAGISESNAALGYGFKVGGHALLGGAMNEATGGDFAEGAIAAGVSAGASPLVDMIPGKEMGNVMSRTAVAAAIGGTSAELGGGKFENGATTAAFMRLFNDEHEALERWVKRLAESGKYQYWTYENRHGALWDVTNGDNAYGPGKLNGECAAGQQVLCGNAAGDMPSTKTWRKGPSLWMLSASGTETPSNVVMARFGVDGRYNSVSATKGMGNHTIMLIGWNEQSGTYTIADQFKIYKDGVQIGIHNMQRREVYGSFLDNFNIVLTKK